MKPKFKKKTSIVVDSKIIRKSYTMSGFNSSLKTYNFKDFYFVSYDKKTNTVKLSNGIGSFTSFLNKKDAITNAIKGQESYILKQLQVLYALSDLFKNQKGR